MWVMLLMNAIKCPKCGGEMEEGVFTEGWWYSGSSSLRKNKSFLGELLGASSLNDLSLWEMVSQKYHQKKSTKGKDISSLRGVKTYRCSVCGYLESYSN